MGDFGVGDFAVWAILHFGRFWRGRFYILGDFGEGDFGVGRFCHLTLVTYRISVDRGASKCYAGQMIRVFRILTEPTLCVLLLFNSGDSEEKAFVPLYDNFVTQRALLGNATVFSNSSYQLDGVQPQALRKLCFSTAASTPTALVGGVRGDAFYAFSGAHHSRERSLLSFTKT